MKPRSGLREEGRLVNLLAAQAERQLPLHGEVLQRGTADSISAGNFGLPQLLGFGYKLAATLSAPLNLMIRRKPVSPGRLWAVTLAIACMFASRPAFADVILDDTWADGERLTQKLPGESAWFASTSEALTAATNALTLSVGDNSVMALTHFTTNAEERLKLRVGEELRVTLWLALHGVAPQNTSEGFRVGILNVADSTLSPKRVSGDGFSSGSQGDGVQGYALFQNMGVKFNNAKPMDIRKRTNPAGTSLLGASGNWSSLWREQLPIEKFGGFENGTVYTFDLSLKRVDATSLTVSMTWSNTVAGTSLSASVIDDDVINYAFDTIALRPASAGLSAASIVFREVKVERILPAAKTSS